MTNNIKQVIKARNDDLKMGIKNTALILGSIFPSYSLIILWLTYRVTHNLAQAIIVSGFISIPLLWGLCKIFQDRP
ncbi:hypothetical protein [Candidatus Phycorickettsia trachydisci]|nr:hypothetical protein [Candidatus Phycorickettsia trachydisci]